MSRRASETFQAAAEECAEREGEPLFDELRRALMAGSIVAKGDEYRRDRCEQETMSNIPLAYATLVEAFLPVATVLAPPETDPPF